MNLKTTGLALAIAILGASCDNYRTQVTETGLKYQLHQHNEAERKSEIGDILTLNLIIQNSTDSILRSTYEEGQPLNLPLNQAPFQASFEEGLAMLHKGDSATFYVNADTMFSKMMQPVPPFIAKGSDIRFVVRLLDVQTMEEFQQDQTAKNSKQKDTDIDIIKEHLDKNNLTAKAKNFESGVYYVTEKEGTGNAVEVGDQIKVDYTGKFLDGTVFDSSVENPYGREPQPLEFQIGTGMVVPGFEEGVKGMKKGEKRTIFIPSPLAYGPNGQPGAIPPNSVLVFDLELRDLTKSAKK